MPDNIIIPESLLNPKRITATLEKNTINVVNNGISSLKTTHNHTSINVIEAEARIISKYIQGPPGLNADEIKIDAFFTYDANGNVLRIDKADSTYKIFNYDSNGTLITITSSDTSIKTFNYDSNNQLTSIINS